MKKLFLFKNKALALFLMLLIAACSSDDGGSSPLDGVPSGEIVPVAERQKTLTGFEEGDAPRNVSTQKWWKYIKWYVKYSCGGETEEESEDGEGEYFAFYPDGTLYMKDYLGGTPYFHSNWEWTDSSKSKIRLSNDGESQVYQVTELNANAAVYAAAHSEEGCTFLTWEQLGQPVFD